MSRKTIAMALIIASIASLSVVSMQAVDSESSEEGTVDIIIHMSGLDNDDPMPAIVAEFESLSERISTLRSEGKNFMVFVDRAPDLGDEANRLIDHMIEQIGREMFIEGPKGHPDHPPTHRGQMKEPFGDRPEPPDHPKDFMVETIPKSTVGDLGQSDPDFVSEVIDFAFESGMDDVAEEISEVLYSNMEAMLRTSSNLCALDTKASGLDDIEDSDDQFYFEEEEDEEPAPPYAGMPITVFEVPPKTPFLQPYQAIILSLDL